MNRHPEERTLQLHMDGELGSAERWEIERHLRECESCRRLHDGYSTLTADLARIPSSVEPPADLWRQIEARIGGIETAAAGRAEPSLPGALRHWRRGVATIVALAASITIGVVLGRQLSVQPNSQSGYAGAEAQAAATLAEYDEASYEIAVADLERILLEMRDELQPETVDAVAENLAIIDRAIADSRAALLTDPANARLHRHLATNMQMKIGLLRMVTAAATRDI